MNQAMKKARRQWAADAAFEHFDFEDNVVLDHDGWTTDGDEMQKVVYIENPESLLGDSIAYTFYVKFSPNSAVVADHGIM